MPAPNIPQIRLYRDWLRETRGLVFDSYDALWRWSVTELDAFWQSIWDYARIESPTPHTAVLAESRMPGARWFPGAQVNYAREVLRHVDAAHAAGMPAIVSDNELGQVREMSWPEMRRQVASVALTLKSLGVQRGDRVAAYMPNVPETMVAFLACSSIGAIWSVCAPDMGTAAVADRFSQIAPKVLIAVDGVHYGGKPLDRSAVLQELRGQLPSVQKLLLVKSRYAAGAVPHDVDWTQAVARNDAEVAAFEPEWLPFDHPIWIVYSSGTTGLPKPIVHGQGGIILTMHACGLHNDVGASYGANNYGERYHWYSSTGWVMWNSQLSGMAFGATICIYDGNPAGSKEKPDWSVLWRFVARHRVTFFGAGAAYFTNCMKAGLVAKECGDLSRVRALGSTGSPLPEEVQRWGSKQILDAGSKDVWWCNISGGTDFCGAFVGGNRDLPEVPGQMQCRELGHAVEAWNEQGQPVIGEVGELVCTRAIPSMPLYFWGDEGNARYVSSYFDTYPGVWRHGDWIRIGEDGGCIIYGRSDATINRQGLRMGTSEIYSAVEGLPEVLDSMVVDLEYLGRESYMPLFVVLRPGTTLDDAMRAKINNAIKTSLSPRFVPNDIFQVAEVPRTLSGKKQELPIKKLLLGQPIEKVVNREAMANPGSLDWFVAFAARRAEAASA
ncbi:MULTISPECIES: acetoacetate--CoA ligase [unclassified Variovorax]|jgi:acetoacetyl-CoA synthetase|uniref:acetoacetate--CoA ligase n=1 Tax=unclassified Variovorax TaxID=663243 RepID=UPI000F7F080E|nr:MULTISPECIES: acetoacetate--CoA ligase [unclassified Variovorax]RSZ31873.1 acetoacetate--CoA ligase [Variovorax sp. 553]RSZ32139.1 acetoacetate--CoA ligase [Variovorax sp. 679]